MSFFNKYTPKPDSCWDSAPNSRKPDTIEPPKPDSASSVWNVGPEQLKTISGPRPPRLKDLSIPGPRLLKTVPVPKELQPQTTASPRLQDLATNSRFEQSKRASSPRQEQPKTSSSSRQEQPRMTSSPRQDQPKTSSNLRSEQLKTTSNSRPEQPKTTSNRPEQMKRIAQVKIEHMESQHVPVPPTTAQPQPSTSASRPEKPAHPKKTDYLKRASGSAFQNMLKKKSQKMLAIRMQQYSFGGQSVLNPQNPESESESSEDEVASISKRIDAIRRIGAKASISGMEVLQEMPQTPAPSSSSEEARKRKPPPNSVEELVEINGEIPPKKKIHQLADKMLKSFAKERKTAERMRSMSISSNNSQESLNKKKSFVHPLNQDSSSDSETDVKPVLNAKPKNQPSSIAATNHIPPRSNSSTVVTMPQPKPEPPQMIPSDPAPCPIKPDPTFVQEQMMDVNMLDDEMQEAIRVYEASKKKQRQPARSKSVQPDASTSKQNSDKPPPKHPRKRVSKSPGPSNSDVLMAMWKLAEDEAKMQDELERLNSEEHKCDVEVDKAMKKRDGIRKRKSDLAKKITTLHNNKKQLLAQKR
ncbi:unnamed protein product [Bursaphelenchus okinawaensis]|uniref:Uncharacterized protein n=1 Tax=Bursaphelenchus okinawaensis TaxID=465554 RepID=A0A811KQH1_9BILA|nr:unnamed protein product [Bursaphelenchus okinawaensis]CAG9110451.1 unnamed protein product [Bursaphelenchus okinawaensis]